MLKPLTKISLYLLAFVPLIVGKRVFFPYTSGKALYIQTLLLLAGILLLINFFYSKSFRAKIIEKTTKYIKHPLVISVLAFISICIISTIFAVDKYSAFWGDLSRAEGLVGMIFFFSFFVFSLLIFEKGDWLWFFKLSLFTTVILLSKMFVEYFSAGILRPGSFTGNPTFLAGYLLFSITSAFIVLHSTISFEIARARNVSPSQTGWRYFSLLVIILSILGLFLTQTRGALLGLFIGVFTILVYLVFKGGDINYKIFNLRKTAIILLSIGLIFSGVFAITRKNDIWQKVPGLSRVAKIGSGDAEDLSTPVRFYLYKSSLKAVNPAENGWKKFLIGWGPENFILAESQNYDPTLYSVEPDWHDRAHNKFLDVLVMNGILGFLAYLAIWLMFFKFIFKKLARTEGFRVVNLALLFFSVSYLTHLFFVFDTPSTSIPFFFILASFVSLDSQGLTLSDLKKGQALSSGNLNEKAEILTVTFLIILTLFIGFVYFRNTLVGYVQMRNYTTLTQNPYTNTFDSEINSVFQPMTLAQMNIRKYFLALTNDLYNKNKDEVSLNLLKKAITKAEEYVAVRPRDFKFQTSLADIYTKKGNSLKNPEYLKKGEQLLRDILTYAPNRLDMIYLLSHNLLYQERFIEAFDIYEKSFVLDLPIIRQDRLQFEEIYTNLIKYFYEQKDKESFIKVVNRLKMNSYADSVALDQILDYLNTTGTWPHVNFD